MRWLIILAVGSILSVARAETLYFEASGLKFVYGIALKDAGDAISGSFTRSEYGDELMRYRFIGKKISEKGAVKKFLVSFRPKELEAQGPPYPFPPKHDLIWTIEEANGKAKLSILWDIETYSSPPKWNVGGYVFDQVDRLTY